MNHNSEQKQEEAMHIDTDSDSDWEPDSTLKQENDRAKLAGMLLLAERVKQQKRENAPIDVSYSAIAELLGRSVGWVKKVAPALKQSSTSADIKTKKRTGRKPTFTQQEITAVTSDCANQRHQSLRKTSRRFGRRTNGQKTMSHERVRQLRHKQGMKPYHRIKVPNITDINERDRASLAEYFVDLFNAQPQALENMIFGDEFYVYIIRKLNHKNDIVWAFRVEDIPSDIRHAKRSRSPLCCGVCIFISQYGIFYQLKEQGVKWDGPHFRNQVIPALHRWITSGNSGIPSPDDLKLAHDCAPGWKANDTQELLQATFGVDSFIPANNMGDGDVPRWPGNSPDMNVIENFGEILMDRVEGKCEVHVGLIDMPILQGYMEETIVELENEPQIMQKLIDSFSRRCQQVINNGGKPLKY